MQVEEVSYPMVVTPAPSSPEESVVGTSVPKDLLRLWQGRLSSRRMDDAEQLAATTFAATMATTTTTTKRPSWWHQQADNDESMETVRVCGMIQDIGETEFLPIAAKNNDTNNNSFVERLPITVVTDWGKEYTKHQDDGDVTEQASKRVCRQRDRPLPTTLIMYVYYPSQEQAAAPIRNELHLHQLVEWIAVKEQPQQQQPDAVSSDQGNIMVDVNSFLQPNYSLLSTWSEDSLSSCISATNNHDWKLPRLHVLAYCLQTVDDLYLRNSHNYIIPPPPSPQPSSPPQQQPLMDTAQAVLFLSEALHLPRPVATALWLTLLSRAEPLRGSHTTTTTTLLGCASIQFVLPHDDALVQRFIACLTALLEPALVTGAWQRWQACHLPIVPRLAQRHGRIARHAWQLPAGSTILVQNDKQHEASTTAAGSSCWATAVLPSLVGQHQMPLLCEACQQVPLSADWRFVVVSTSRREGSPALPCTATVDLPFWTPGFTAPPPAVHARWARTLASRRLATPSVTLSAAVRQRAPNDFCGLRQARSSSSSSTCPDEAAFHRWLTYARLLARSRGSATADIVDWEQALQLDQALNAQGRF